MGWIPDKWQPLPTNEWLLTLVDHCHNLTNNRRFGTFAVGAVGKSPHAVTFVLGVNSNVFHEILVTADRNVPPVVRNAAELANVAMAKEPYHAEVSCVLWARENDMKLIAVASSRVVCPICREFLPSHAPTAQVVDVWKTSRGTLLTQEDRKRVNLGSDWANEMGDSRMKAVYSAEDR